jgi:hypothetical protein
MGSGVPQLLAGVLYLGAGLGLGDGHFVVEAVTVDSLEHSAFHPITGIAISPSGGGPSIALTR